MKGPWKVSFSCFVRRAFQRQKRWDYPSLSWRKKQRRRILDKVARRKSLATFRNKSVRETCLLLVLPFFPAFVGQSQQTFSQPFRGILGRMVEVLSKKSFVFKHVISTRRTKKLIRFRKAHQIHEKKFYELYKGHKRLRDSWPRSETDGRGETFANK